VDLAIRMAYDAKTAGAWGFKTQLLQPELIASADAPKYWDDTLGTRTQREAFTKAGLVDYGAWAEVKAACDDIGIVFFATPFDLTAVEALHAMGVQHYKVASGDLTYRDLIRACRDTGGEVILSTGAAYKQEIDRALTWAPDATLLACTLSYPTPYHAAHLARIERLRKEYPPNRVGYSDHTSWPRTALAAAALGADLLEVHYTHDNDAADVPDHAIAVDPQRLAEYCAYADMGAMLRGSSDLIPCDEELRARRGARRSAHATRDLIPGQRLTPDDYVWVRPAGPVAPWHDVDGKTVIEAVAAGKQIRHIR
jgi:sialic acid synthase SpsE